MFGGARLDWDDEFRVCCVKSPVRVAMKTSPSSIFVQRSLNYTLLSGIDPYRYMRGSCHECQESLHVGLSLDIGVTYLVPHPEGLMVSRRMQRLLLLRRHSHEARGTDNAMSAI
jgi:hypothetical protein